MNKNDKISSLLKPADDIKDYAYLSSFLKNQIGGSKTKMNSLQSDCDAQSQAKS